MTWLLLDAFSSDSPPLHLLTREALGLHLQKLAPHGVLAFNMTNGYLDLAPVVGTLAADAQLTALVVNDLGLGPAELAKGRSPSPWVVLAGASADLGRLAQDSRWAGLLPDPGVPVWHDDFTSILSVFHWR